MIRAYEIHVKYSSEVVAGFSVFPIGCSMETITDTKLVEPKPDHRIVR